MFHALQVGHAQGLHVGALFCGNRLVICSSCSYSYWALLQPVLAELEEGPLYTNSAPVVKAVPMMCLVPEVSSLCELSQSHTETTTKCMWTKLDVSNICRGRNYDEIYTGCSSDRDSGSVFYRKNSISHTIIYNYIYTTREASHSFSPGWH